jgi:NAD(P)-dependent dehydrogenase (short-subunit alcohol dehydrogenase family)
MAVPRRILITGADRGIGEALAIEARRRGDDVYATCLGDSPRLRELGIRVEADVDVTSTAATRALGGRLAGIRLDVIVSNAGICLAGELGALDDAAMLREFDVNALGPLRIVEALLPNLSAGAKIAVLTSRVGSIAENGTGGLYGYRMSKAAANMAVVCLARDLAKRGIAVMSLHPGTVRTDMAVALSADVAKAVAGTFVEPHDAARNLLVRIDELTLEQTATFRHANGDRLPW